MPNGHEFDELYGLGGSNTYQEPGAAPMPVVHQKKKKQKGYQERLRDLTQQGMDYYGLSDYLMGGKYGGEAMLQRGRELVGPAAQMQAAAPGAAADYVRALMGAVAPQVGTQAKYAYQQYRQSRPGMSAAARLAGIGSIAEQTAGTLTGMAPGAYQAGLQSLNQAAALNAQLGAQRQMGELGMLESGAGRGYGVGMFGAQSYIDSVRAEMQKRAAERAEKRSSIGDAIGGLFGFGGQLLGQGLMPGGFLRGSAGYATGGLSNYTPYGHPPYYGR